MAMPSRQLSTMDIPSAQNGVSAKHPTIHNKRAFVLSIPRKLWLWLKWWGWEVGACVGSFGVFLATYLLLKAYDGKAQPDWLYGITLNSAASWLTTITKSMLLVPAAACIDQSSWIYYASRARNLGALSVYDAASRGPWGSMQLLWTLRAR